MEDLVLKKEDLDELSVEELVDLKFELKDMLHEIDSLLEQCDEALAKN